MITPNRSALIGSYKQYQDCLQYVGSLGEDVDYRAEVDMSKGAQAKTSAKHATHLVLGVAVRKRKLQQNTQLAGEQFFSPKTAARRAAKLTLAKWCRDTIRKLKTPTTVNQRRLEQHANGTHG